MCLTRKRERNIEYRLERIENLLQKILGEVIKMGDTLFEMTNKLIALEEEVVETSTVVDSAVVLLNGLSQLLKDSQGDPARVQAVIDALDAKTSELADAVAATTPVV